MQDTEYREAGESSDSGDALYGAVRSMRKSYARYFLALIAYTAVAYFVIIAFELAAILIFNAPEILSNIYVNWLLNTVPTYIFGFGVFYLIIRKMKTYGKEKSRITVPEFLIFFCIANLLMTVGALIGNLLNAQISALIGKEIKNDVSDMIESTPIWLIILVVVIIGPLIEELLYRKFFIDKLGFYNEGAAIITSALAFGLFHGNFYQFFYAFLLGIVLAAIYSKTRNLAYSYIMHALINFFGSVVSIFVMRAYEKYDECIKLIEAGEKCDPAVLAGSVLTIVFYLMVNYGTAIFGFVMLIRWRSRIFRKPGSDLLELSAPDCRAAIMKNIGVIAFTVLAVIQFAVGIIQSALA